MLIVGGNDLMIDVSVLTPERRKECTICTQYSRYGTSDDERSSDFESCLAIDARHLACLRDVVSALMKVCRRLFVETSLLHWQ
jgi:hypothetical protein